MAYNNKMAMPENLYYDLKVMLITFLDHVNITTQDQLELKEKEYRQKNPQIKDIKKGFVWEIYHHIPTYMRQDWINSVYNNGCNDDHIETVLINLLSNIEDRYNIND